MRHTLCAVVVCFVFGACGGASPPTSRVPTSVVVLRAPHAASRASAPVERTPTCPAGMVTVPGGSFWLAIRRRTVTVATFCMDVTEVTAGAYAACVRTGACTEWHVTGDDSAGKTPDRRFIPDPACNYGVRPSHPMNCVDWAQSAAYCSAHGKRLPTEAQWQWAARGGPEARTYPWGSAKPGTQLCWSGVHKRAGTCPVGATPAGDAPGGIHDLAGNVYEWTSTPYPRNCPGCMAACGGSWYQSTVAITDCATPPADDHDAQWGFRCVR